MRFLGSEEVDCITLRPETQHCRQPERPGVGQLGAGAVEETDTVCNSDDSLTLPQQRVPAECLSLTEGDNTETGACMGQAAGAGEELMLILAVGPWFLHL